MIFFILEQMFALTFIDLKVKFANDLLIEQMNYCALVICSVLSLHLLKKA